jgi:glycosyltransferase involved in cell wall biosynthesis
MDTHVVTVVIATFRRAESLRHAIGSVLDQIYGDHAILISDNADDPGIRRLAESFDDPRIRYRSNPSNLGTAGNHLAAISAARGRYITILHEDDLWRPDWLATTVRASTIV